MATMEELKAKYNGIKYEPNPDCRKCHGEGEFIVKKLGELAPCVCLYVSHDFCEELGQMLGQWAKKQMGAGDSC